MNTKKYLQMFGELADKKEIPLELYGMLVSEIAKDGRMTKRVYGVYLTELEKRGLFDAEGAPFDTRKSAKTDGTFKYRHNNIFWHIAHGFCAGVLKIIGYVAGGIGFGVWRVADRKKLKGIPSYIATSNHIGYLDIVLSRRAAGAKRFYAVVAPHNCKRTLGGAILKATAAVPLPSGIRGAKPFSEMLEYAKSKKSVIHIYPEKSMWIGYKKPRPYKDGAFYYADALDLPVVPVLYCYCKPNFLRRTLHLPKIKIRICDPVYADKTLKPRERRKDMNARAFAELKAVYEAHYGIPLEYENDIQPIDTAGKL